MPYHINIKPKVFKSLEKLNEPTFSAVKDAIYALAFEPRPHGCKKLKGREGYRIRVGDYRIIYHIIDDVLVVNVIAAGHRRDIYE